MPLMTEGHWKLLSICTSMSAKSFRFLSFKCLGWPPCLWRSHLIYEKREKELARHRQRTAWRLVRGRGCRGRGSITKHTKGREMKSHYHCLLTKDQISLLTLTWNNPRSWLRSKDKVRELGRKKILWLLCFWNLISGCNPLLEEILSQSTSWLQFLLWNLKLTAWLLFISLSCVWYKNRIFNIKHQNGS